MFKSACKFGLNTIRIACFEPHPRTHATVIKQYEASAQERSERNHAVQHERSKIIRQYKMSAQTTIRQYDLGNQTVNVPYIQIRSERSDSTARVLGPYSLSALMYIQSAPMYIPSART